jgi:hypothetical protein
VVIVSNYSGVTKTITAPDVDLFWPTGGWDNSCGAYSLLSGTARACFGTTIGDFSCGEWLQTKAKITVTVLCTARRPSRRCGGADQQTVRLNFHLVNLMKGAKQCHCVPPPPLQRPC